jgi:hypothetical protein
MKYVVRAPKTEEADEFRAYLDAELENGIEVEWILTDKAESIVGILLDDEDNIIDDDFLKDFREGR